MLLIIFYISLQLLHLLDFLCLSVFVVLDSLFLGFTKHDISHPLFVQHPNLGVFLLLFEVVSILLHRVYNLLIVVSFGLYILHHLFFAINHLFVKTIFYGLLFIVLIFSFFSLLLFVLTSNKPRYFSPFILVDLRGH